MYMYFIGIMYIYKHFKNWVSKESVSSVALFIGVTERFLWELLNVCKNVCHITVHEDQCTAPNESLQKAFEEFVVKVTFE